MLTRNYRGISLTSVFAKLSHNTNTETTGIPQATQTAYVQILFFASTEALPKFKSQGDNAYSCFYDLTSAFDTVEFCVLLQNLFHAGVKGNAGGFSVTGIET